MKNSIHQNYFVPAFPFRFTLSVISPNPAAAAAGDRQPSVELTHFPPVNGELA